MMGLSSIHPSKKRGALPPCFLYLGSVEAEGMAMRVDLGVTGASEVGVSRPTTRAHSHFPGHAVGTGHSALHIESKESTAGT
jgi:hypothetical protein